MTGGDDALLRSFGDEATGLSCSAYSLSVQTVRNERFIEGMRKNFDVIPGFYAAGLYINCQVADAALQAAGGDIGDREKLIAALRAVALTDTPRGPLKFVRSLGQRRRQFLCQALRTGRRQIWVEVVE